jgi:hypothetical protein
MGVVQLVEQSNCDPKFGGLNPPTIMQWVHTGVKFYGAGSYKLEQCEC